MYFRNILSFCLGWVAAAAFAADPPAPTPPLEGDSTPPAAAGSAPAAADGYSAAAPATRSKVGYTAVPVDGPYVALTFDDGPHGTLTPKLLDMLAQKKVKATFFILGQCAQEHPEIMKRIAAEGHELANHSWSHPNFAKLSDDAIRSQIGRTEALIAAVGGNPNKLLRPPYGSLNDRQRRWIPEQLGYKIIMWSVDPLDWKRPGPAAVTRRIVSATSPGAIVLAHDIHPGTIESVPGTIDELAAKGMKFVTVSELLAMEKAPTPRPSPTPKPQATPEPGPAQAEAADPTPASAETPAEKKRVKKARRARP